MLLPALAFGQSSHEYSPMGVGGIATFWTGVASLITATGFGLDLGLQHDHPRSWNEPLLTGSLVAAGVVLVAVSIYLLMADAMGSMVRGLI